jgi:hypothetical protein
MRLRATPRRRGVPRLRTIIVAVKGLGAAITVAATTVTRVLSRSLGGGTVSRLITNSIGSMRAGIVAIPMVGVVVDVEVVVSVVDEGMGGLFCKGCLGGTRFPRFQAWILCPTIGIHMSCRVAACALGLLRLRSNIAAVLSSF